MDWNDAHQVEVFFEAHAGLIRQGPGNAETTARALELVGPLPAAPRIVDFGCGPGTSTVDLAERLPGAEVLGLDLHAPFIAELERSARERGLSERVRGVVGDMAAPPGNDVFDLMWSEGAAYSIGFEHALRCWRERLAPGGRIACSEALWLTDERPAQAVQHWQEYPEMTDRAGCLERVARAGLRLVADFTLPEKAWLEHYYDPMERTLETLRERHAGDAAALSVLEECQSEIDVYRLHSDAYGYQFFILERG